MSYAHFLFILEVFFIKNNNSNDTLINENIGYPDNKKVLVISKNGKQVMNFSQAIDAAYNVGMDLVLMNGELDQPVCKIMDYGKYRFEKNKREKEAKKKQQIADIKEIQLSIKIETNDFNTKVNRARNFLTRGDKCKVVVRFRGRQMAYQQQGLEMLERFRDACSDICTVDKEPKLEGRFLSMFLGPIKQTANK